MAFEGWISYGSVEVANSARVRAYVGAAPWWDRSRDPEDEDLHLALGDGAYGSPFSDNPPWVDPNDMDTYRFWGVHPLSVTGLEDSTRTATVSESILDGGFIGGRRKATRSIVVGAMLLGEDDAAVAAGLNWLSSVLDGSCSDCDGDSLCYLQAIPYIDETLADPSECAEDYIRTIPRVSCISGPTVVAKTLLSDDSVMWRVQFAFTAQTPWVFGTEIEVAADMIASSRAALPGFLWPPIEQRDFDCPGSNVGPANLIQDPLLPPFPVVPTIPRISNLGYAPPDAWSRWAMQLPEALIPQWNDVVPTLRIRTGPVERRYLRFRYHADPLGRFSVPDLDSCSYCGEFVISYLPPDSIITIDGVAESITVELPGGIVVDGESLVWGTDGGPFVWPVISCGFSYVLTMDTIRDSDPPAMVSVALNQRF